MSLQLDKILVTKNGSKGSASLYISDEDGVNLVINGIIIDVTNGASPVDILRCNGSPIISGNIIEGIKDLILDIFEAIKEEQIGVFEYANDEVVKL